MHPSRRVFLSNFMLFSLSPKTDEAKIVEQINKLTREYVKVQMEVNKRRAHFYEVKAAETRNLYRKMSEMHTRFAQLFTELADL